MDGGRAVRFIAVLALLQSVTSFAGEPRDARIEAARKKAQARIAERQHELRLTDPEKELREVSAVPSRMSVIVRYQQVRDGIPVYGAQLILRVNGDQITENSNLVGPLIVSTTPKLDATAAARIALHTVKLKAPDRPAPELQIVPHRGLGDVPDGDRLAWRVSVTASNEQDGVVSRLLYVDAHTGEILMNVSDLSEVSYHAMTASFEGNWTTGSEWLIARLSSNLCCVDQVWIQDPCFGTGVSPLDADGDFRCGSSSASNNLPYTPKGFGNWVGNANGKTTTNPKIMSLQGIPGNQIGDGILGSSNPFTVAADAHAYVFDTFLYLLWIHGRNGLDHNNGPAVRSIVRYPGFPSFWYSRDNAVVLSSPDNTYYDGASADIIAHELGHALSDYGPRLAANSGTESTKLREATANMFAMLVSGSPFSDDPVPYRIGENIIRSAVGALTFMDDPARKSGTVTCYTPENRFLESHRGAGPGDHMFYLLVYGGESKCNGNIVAGIGYEAAEAIWYDAFHGLLPDATYAKLRNEFITAASLYQSGPTNVLASTHAAFDAVNIP